jgi:hypothetical protein
VGSMVRFVHFIVDIIAFFSGVRDNELCFSLYFQLKEWIHTAFGFDGVFICIVFSVMELSFKTLGKFITKTKVVTLKGKT